MNAAMPTDADRLLLAHSDVALALVDPANGQLVHCNPVWPLWLGMAPDALLHQPLGGQHCWLQPEVVRALLGLAALALPLTGLSLSARTAAGDELPLLVSLKSVPWRERKHLLCTMVRQPVAQATAGGDSDHALQAVVQMLTGLLERHDPASVGHQRRVADLAATLARRLGWPQAEVQSITMAAWLHDLGMLQVPATVLGQRALLTTEQVEQIQQHVTTGVHMLEHIDFPGPVTALIAQHHERLDGSGYPAGLQGQAILRGAQLIGMADMLDAMTRERPYQHAQPMDQALGTLLAGAGILFDADLVQACVALFAEDGYRFPEA